MADYPESKHTDAEQGKDCLKSDQKYFHTVWIILNQGKTT